MVLERRRLFGAMTVRENILLGAYHRSVNKNTASRLEWVESLFPILPNVETRSRRMSGGEQQMVAIARSLMSRPRLLLMDEPLSRIGPPDRQPDRQHHPAHQPGGISVVFNEQNVRLSFGVSHRGYLLESGRMMLTVPARR